VDPAAVGVAIWGGRQVSKFAERAFGKALDELGDYLAGEVRERIVARRRRAVERAAAALEDAGITAGPVPLKLARSILVETGFEEDEGLSERWAALLANAADPSAPGAVLPIFPQILSLLTPKDALLLDYFAEQSERTAEQLVKSEILNDEDLTIALASLRANNLVERLSSIAQVGESGNHYGLREETYALTELGRRFVRACELPSKGP
jgi:hypothetical protein